MSYYALAIDSTCFFDHFIAIFSCTSLFTLNLYPMHWNLPTLSGLLILLVCSVPTSLPAQGLAPSVLPPGSGLNHESSQNVLALTSASHPSKLEFIERPISGTVTDENGDGLPGVNVLVKNTTIGTVTDIEGNYSISAPDNAETLIFSSVGYLSQEVAIGNQSTIDINMEPDVQSLDEVVVVGYGTQRNLT